jgi:rubredoxin
MKHPDASCDCAGAVSPLTVRWRCPVCGMTAIMNITTFAAVCSGDTMRKVEPEVASHQSTPGP